MVQQLIDTPEFAKRANTTERNIDYLRRKGAFKDAVYWVGRKPRYDYENAIKNLQADRK